MSCKKLLVSLWLAEKSYLVLVHLFRLNSSSLYGMPLYMCRCVAQTLRDCLKRQGMITKKTTFGYRGGGYDAGSGGQS